MLIIADTNEQATSPDTIKQLRDIFPKLTVSKLTCGDLNVILDDGTILAIERKDVHDLLQSIGDGRLFRQVENMAGNAKYYAIIAEGTLGFTSEDMTIANGEETNWRGVSVRAALFSVMWSGCPVNFVPKNYYAFAVEEMIDFVSKDDEHLQRSHKRIVTFPPVSIQVDILAAFPGIGIKKADALLTFIGNRGNHGSLVEGIAWAAAFPLIKPENRPTGWGNGIVARFRETLGLKPDQYLEIKKEEQQDVQE